MEIRVRCHVCVMAQIYASRRVWPVVLSTCHYFHHHTTLCCDDGHFSRKAIQDRLSCASSHIIVDS
jgi:hypothetical protein